MNTCIVFFHYVFALCTSFGFIALTSFIISIYLSYLLIIIKLYMFYKNKKYINKILGLIILLLFVIIHIIFNGKRI